MQVIKNVSRAILILLLSTNLYAATTNFHLAKYSKQQNPILKAVKQKSTVGIIPYYVQTGKIYIFLGQELSGGMREKAGTFSDFGGTMEPDGKTILDHAIREFREETMHQMRLDPEYILKNGYLLHKKTTKGRDIYYIFVKFSKEQFKLSKKLNVAKIRLKASSPPNSHFEKESFAWVDLNDILKQVPATPDTTTSDVSNVPMQTPYFTAKTPDGSNISILIRNYFLEDCLQNSNLPELIKILAK